MSEKFMPQYASHPEAQNRSTLTSRLASEEQLEVLEFLSAQPLHNVFLSSLILDNGLVSPLNRGTFYGCRDALGQLEGVALIGHATLFDARSDEALKAFARLAQSSQETHLILGQRERLREFWSDYAEGGQASRLACTEMLFEQRWPVAVQPEVKELRVATQDDLELVMPAHAQMAHEESGVNPLEVDEAGFRRRCARRIAQGRVWVWVEDGRLIFKADIIAETPRCVYLEGIYVHPAERSKGYGSRCLSQLGQSLLQRADSICLLVNEENQKARDFYLRAGYKLRSTYDTIFLH
ncbi:MAG TPA: GNAT family N-acetyltransferase [Pyrinomonadaceae bacterium]|nr:GNAT family N-acetyltransferase [Pyrinomonadaceae bacterium]